MTWDVLNVIGTMAFAISGAIIAMEEDYDLLGVLILGLATAFGGGIIRNILIDVPMSTLWEQDILIKVTVLIIALIFFIPEGWIHFTKGWLNFFDAVGLSTFAIQGALYAYSAGHSLTAIIMAAVMTGTGGGIVRDLLAGRKPTVLRYDIYAAWAIIAGIFIGTGITSKPWELYLLCGILITLRLFSAKYRWKLPHRYLQTL
ncbi:trimeric intracellular cation channel family protein [Pseudalkalibacillus berkeleyi]|uniref:Trimeric intracellular cation channel family protein n=1 Tax=Pseudalkalibacillus berkeleyi TaxID=1069813 RepID=A0ABS9H042_9BACL|nr:trimeric intracellular cation channel family protein [Pseudalkalibacillus berkeleyi]MCF6137264.1 trimeric intracellular cation channel family protein [Pseudalkalibacillus berkeleyi]